MSTEGKAKPLKFKKWTVPKLNYPTPMQHRLTKFQNGVFNRLFPIHPVLYLGIATALSLVVYQSAVASINGDNQLNASHRLLIPPCVLIAFAVTYFCVALLRFAIRRWLFAYTGFLHESRGKLSTKTKIWGIFVKALTKLAPRPLLTSYENLMPARPLPTLKQTIDVYLESMRPVLSDEEYTEEVSRAEDFLANEGPKVQNYLWMFSLLNANWVTKFWIKYAYLHNRLPLTVHSSIGVLDTLNPAKCTQAARAGFNCWAASQLNLSIATERLGAPVYSGVPMTSAHYWWAYNTTRKPVYQGCDELHHYPLARHAAAWHKGRWYKVPVCDESGATFTPAEFEMGFDRILDGSAIIDGEMTESYSRLNALSMMDRDTWAKNRERLLASPTNQRTLEMIDQATGLLMLADPETAVDVDWPRGCTDNDVVSKSMWFALCGTGCDRWPDKSLAWMFMPDGRCLSLTEHSWGDGMEFGHVREYALKFEMQLDPYCPSTGRCKDRNVTKGAAPVEEFPWELDAKMEVEIDRCYLAVRERHDDVHVASMMHMEYGKDRIKKYKCSPDAWVQMAIQLAFFKDQQYTPLTYESSSARLFVSGRTETYRVATMASKSFVDVMRDDESTKATRITKLRAACDRHSTGNKKALAGEVCDRHLFALFIVSQGKDVSSPFLQKVIRETPWTLSTSHAPTVTKMYDEREHDDGRGEWAGAGFGPVTNHGYGICYRFLGEHAFAAHLSSYRNAQKFDATRMRNNFMAAMKEMNELFDEE